MALHWLEEEKARRDEKMSQVSAKVQGRRHKGQPVLRRKEMLVEQCRQIAIEFARETDWRSDDRDLSRILDRRLNDWNAFHEFYVFPSGGGGFFIAIQERIKTTFFLTKKTELRVQVKLAPTGGKQKSMTWVIPESGFNGMKLQKAVSMAWRATGWL